jgi:hypothetical protein
VKPVLSATNENYQSISVTFETVFKRFLAFFFHDLHHFFCYEKADVLKLQVTENQQYKLKG